MRALSIRMSPVIVSCNVAPKLSFKRARSNCACGAVRSRQAPGMGGGSVPRMKDAPFCDPSFVPSIIVSVTSGAAPSQAFRHRGHQGCLVAARSPGSLNPARLHLPSHVTYSKELRPLLLHLTLLEIAWELAFKPRLQRCSQRTLSDRRRSASFIRPKDTHLFAEWVRLWQARHRRGRSLRSSPARPARHSAQQLDRRARRW